MLHYLHTLSLRSRVSLLTLGMVFASLWSLTLLVSNSLRHDVEILVGQQQLATARTMAHALDHAVQRRLGALETLAMQIPPAALRAPVQAQAQLHAYRPLDELFPGGVTLHDIHGITVADTLPTSGRVGTPLPAPGALQESLQQGHPSISAPFTDPLRSGLRLAMVVPVRDAGGIVVGAAVGHILLEMPDVLDTIGRTHFDNAANYLLIDRTQRVVVAASQAERVGKPAAPLGQIAAVDRFMRGGEGTAVFVNSLGEEVLAAAQQIPSAPWFVAVSTPTAQAFLPVRATQLRLWWGAAIVSVLALLLTRWVATRQLAPAESAVRELTRRAALVQQDAPTQPLEVHRPDEIGQLIDAFNALLQAEVQRKALLREVFNTSNVGIFSADASGNIGLANAMLGRMFLRSVPELVGTNYLQLVAPQERALVQHNMTSLQEAPSMALDVTRRFVRSDGTEFWGQVSLRQIQPTNEGPRGVVGVVSDISAQVASRDYELFRRETLEQLARNVPLDQTLDTIVRGVEQLSPQALCSILLLQPDGKHLAQGVAPSLPPDYNAAVEGIEIGPYVGSCGAAAYLRERVVARDLQVHGNWAAYRDLTARFGLGACWSQPLMGSKDEVLGTIAIYHRSPQEPSDADIELIEQAAHLASLAIAKHRTRQALAESEARYRAMIEWAPTPLAVHRAGVIVFANPAAVRMLGAPSVESVLGRQILEFIHPDSRELVMQRAREAAQPGRELPMASERYLRFDGTVIDVEAVAAHIHFDGTAAVLVSMQDVTRRLQAQRRLWLAGQVFDHAREGIMVTDTQGTIVEVNAAFTRITGYSRDEIVGQNPRMLKSGRQSKAYYSAMWKALLANGNWTGEVWNRRKSGEIFAELQTISTVRNDAGQAINYVSLFSDITAAKEHAQYIERIAHYDVLTNLPNRVLLADRLHQAMTQAQRRGLQTGVAFLDLDGFKAVNDRHGHDVGDQLLMTLAQRMRKSLREGDTLARIGGDEFVAVLVDLPDTQACVPLLERLLQAAGEPVEHDGHILQVTASVGVAFYPQSEDINTDQLLRQADQAMYQAKLAGKNRYHVFDADQDRHVRGHHESLDRIRNALAANEFVLHYQPKVNMRTGELRGAEALIRWNHPEQGLLPPAAFLPVVEDHPLAVDIGRWVLATAVQQLAQWTQDGHRFRVSVNIGAQQLQHANFLDELQAVLAQHPHVAPQQLELEVLETSALEDLAHVSEVIQHCNRLGVGFALDDFGTGYSSLSYLKRLPASLLKIDQSFVRDMLDDPDDLAILDGVIGLASAFRREVIAEGVETEPHGKLLLQLGCELGQGYGIARPMPAALLVQWAAQWTAPESWQRAKRVHREDFALLYALAESRAWSSSVASHIQGQRAPLTHAELNECRFGRWLNREGAQRYGHHPAFVLLDTLHERMHAHARQLHQWAAQGQSDPAREGLPLLIHMQEQLDEHIQRLLNTTPHQG